MADPSNCSQFGVKTTHFGEKMAQFQVKKPQAKTLQERMGFVDRDLATPGHDAIMLWCDEQLTPSQLFTWLKKEEGWGNTSELEEALVTHLQRYIANFSSKLTYAIEAENNLRRLIDHPAKGYDSTYYARNLPAATAKVMAAQREMEEAQARVTPALAIPPWPGIPLIKKEWEMPIMSGTYTIGFVDLVAYYDYPTLSFNNREEIPSWLIHNRHGCVYFEVKTTIPSLGELFRQLSLYREHLGHDAPIFIVSPDTRFEAKICEQGYGFIQSPEVR